MNSCKVCGHTDGELVTCGQCGWEACKACCGLDPGTFAEHEHVCNSCLRDIEKMFGCECGQPMTRTFLVALDIEVDDESKLPTTRELATALDSTLHKTDSLFDEYKYGELSVYDNLRWLVEDWEEGTHKNLSYEPTDEFGEE